MYCHKCGVVFYNFDIILGNCVRANGGYVHAYASDCVASDDEIRTQLPKPKPVSGGGNSSIDIFTTTPNNGSLPPTAVEPPPPSWHIVPTQKHLFDTTIIQTVFDVDSDDNDDQPFLITSSPTDKNHEGLQYGFTGEKYWMCYANQVFLGRRTKHMQGVQMAIADMYGIPIAPIFEGDFKNSPHALPFEAPTHKIVASDVLANLPAPFRLRYNRDGSMHLYFREHIITHNLKAVLAGYVVAARALSKDIG
jgi:hypothetical protein